MTIKTSVNVADFFRHFFIVAEEICSPVMEVVSSVMVAKSCLFLEEEISSPVIEEIPSNFGMWLPYCPLHQPFFRAHSS